MSEEDIIKQKINEILSELPENFDVESCAQKHPVKYEQSMNTVL